MLGIAVIGYGHWGPRIVRNFHSADGCKVVSICDKRASTLQLPARDFPSVETTSEFQAGFLSRPETTPSPLSHLSGLTSNWLKRR